MNPLVTFTPRRALIALMISLSLSACSKEYPKFFDITWDEEIKLHDGRSIVVHVKNTYERIDRSRQFENAIGRRNEFTFDAGADHGVITFSSRLGVRSLDFVAGDWYVVLFGQGPYGNFPEEMPNHWGTDYTISEERLGKLIGKEFQPISWDGAPPGSLSVPNRIISSVPLDVLANFDKKSITLADKKYLLETYPPGPGAAQIDRPLRMQTKPQGNSK